MRISAYVPCFNNASTLRDVVKSIQSQSVPPDELLVVDDGSNDGSSNIARDLGCRVISHEKNLGRGATRARAISEAAHDLVLSCDATNAIPTDFVERALPWFDSDKVAAVFGRMWQEDDSTAAQRWRKRHLFKAGANLEVSRKASLATGSVLMRRSHALAVGNFNPQLRHSEDADLGARLLGAGYQVVFDPSLHTMPLTSDTIAGVLERYWRWNAGKDESFSRDQYLRNIAYSFKVMARQDLAADDLRCVPISLLIPHYQLWRSRRQRLSK